MAHCFVDLTDSADDSNLSGISKPLASLSTINKSLRKPTKQTTLFSFFNSSESAINSSNELNTNAFARDLSKRPILIANHSDLTRRSSETVSRRSSQSAGIESLSNSKFKSEPNSKHSGGKPRSRTSTDDSASKRRRAASSSPPASSSRPPTPRPALSREELEARLRDAYACAIAECSQPQFDRTLPNWKRIDGTRVSVDAFEFWKRASEDTDPKTRRIRGCALYCLSHYHSDHYGGLARCFSSGPIVCSQVSCPLCA